MSILAHESLHFSVGFDSHAHPVLDCCRKQAITQAILKRASPVGSLVLWGFLNTYPWANFSPMMPSTIRDAEPRRTAVLGSP
jgi:hypothetical protein